MNVMYQHERSQSSVGVYGSVDRRRAVVQFRWWGRIAHDGSRSASLRTALEREHVPRMRIARAR